VEKRVGPPSELPATEPGGDEAPLEVFLMPLGLLLFAACWNSTGAARPCVCIHFANTCTHMQPYITIYYHVTMVFLKSSRSTSSLLGLEQSASFFPLKQPGPVQTNINVLASHERYNAWQVHFTDIMQACKISHAFCFVADGFELLSDALPQPICRCFSVHNTPWVRLYTLLQLRPNHFLIENYS
jgi:hypothetical protein